MDKIGLTAYATRNFNFKFGSPPRGFHPMTCCVSMPVVSQEHTTAIIIPCALLQLPVSSPSELKMTAFIRSPACANCACYLEPRRRGRGVHPMDMWFDQPIEPCDHYYPFYYYQSNGLRRQVRPPEEEAPFGMRLPDADAPFVFVHRRTPSDGELLQSLARRLEALEEFIAVAKKQPTPSHSTRAADRSHPHPNPNAHRSRRQAGKNAVKKTTSHAQKRPSLRLAPDHAATIIQSRFRAYLVRRSQTLGHLRDLAVAKSTLKDLNALFADIGYRIVLCREPDERRSFSERAISLLLKVDSIPGSNFMVREARRSISKEIVGLLDAVDHLELRTANRKRVRSKRQPKVQREEWDASQGFEVRDAGGSCSPGTHVPTAQYCGGRATTASEQEAFDGLNERGGLGFGVSWSSGHQRKPYGSKPPAFTFRDHGGKTWPLPPYLQREIVEVLAMTGLGLHLPYHNSSDCICDQWGFQ